MRSKVGLQIRNQFLQGHPHAGLGAGQMVDSKLALDELPSGLPDEGQHPLGGLAHACLKRFPETAARNTDANAC